MTEPRPPYGPGNPHPFDDPNQQRGNQDYPGSTYPDQGVDAVVNPEDYQRYGPQGQRDYYAAREQAAAYARDSQRPPAYGPASQAGHGPVVSNTNIPGVSLDGAYPVTVNYDWTPDYMVERAGCWGMSADSVEKCIRQEGEGTQTANLYLARCNFDVSFSRVSDLLGDLGVRAATVPELLAFSTAYPARQLADTIVEADTMLRPLGVESRAVILTVRQANREPIVATFTPVRSTGVFFIPARWLLAVAEPSQNTTD